MIGRCFLFAVVLALGAASVRSATPAINTEYRVTGHPDAAPVQVFDDGRELFVQLRDPRSVPAPFVGGQPANYRIRGNYLVLPLTPAFELRMGAAVVTVVRSGMPAGQEAQIFRSVDPLAEVPRPSVPPTMGATPASPAAIPPRGVVGEIALEREPARPAAQGPAPASGANRLVVPHDRPATRELFAPLRGRRVQVLADGTVTGAQRAERLRAVCTVAGPTACTIGYRGAAAGTSVLEAQ